jgi:hypothetical protein
VSLGRLILAWLPVAAWFIMATWISRWAAGRGWPASQTAAEQGAAWMAGEAVVVTLFASLWFDSLGSGGWWLLFFLVGLLVAFPIRAEEVLAGALPARTGIVLALADTARYIGAGAILAWRLR